MKILIALAALTLALPVTTATAEEDTAMRLAERVGVLTFAEEMEEVVKRQVERRLYDGNAPSSEARALAEETVEVAFAAARGDLARRHLDIYRRHFSEEEITALVGFFETPLGGKVAEIYPGLVQDGMAVVQQWGQQVGGGAARAALQAVREAGLRD